MLPYIPMNKLRWGLFIFTAFSSLYATSSIAYAQSKYYVRAGATGSGSGEDWINAFPAMPSQFVRGSIYYVATGTYTGVVNLNTPVSSNSIITIRKATLSDHGTDAGWLNIYGNGSALFTSGFDISTSFWEIDGQTGIDRSDYGIEISTLGQREGISMNTPVSDISVRFCNIHSFPETASLASLRAGPYRHAVRIIGGKNVSFSRCYIHHIFGTCFLVRGTTGLLIERCYLSNNASTPAQHAEAISDDGSDVVTLRYNKFCDIDGTAFIACLNGTADSTAASWNIYGNVFWHTGLYGSTVSKLIEVAEDSSNNVHASNWNIFNNTVATVTSFTLSFNSPKTIGVQVFNNIFWQDRFSTDYFRYGYIQIYGTGSAYRNNYYAQCAFPFAMVQGPNENPIFDGPNCRLSDAPGFPGFVNPASGDFRLRGPINGYAGRPLTDAFPTLPLDDAFNIDIAGSRRGADLIWDIGAYEVQTPPSNAKIQVQVSPPTS